MIDGHDSNSQKSDACKNPPISYEFFIFNNGRNLPENLLYNIYGKSNCDLEGVGLPLGGMP